MISNSIFALSRHFSNSQICLRQNYNIRQEIQKKIQQKRAKEQMGCTTSDFESENSCILRNLSPTNKQRLANTIQDNDVISMAILMQQIEAYPNSEISQSKMNWNLIHLCCRWDSHKCLDFLLRLFFVENPKGYVDFVNGQTVEGYTPLHLCCIWGSIRCFKVLLDFGALALSLKDNKLKTPYQQAIQYKSLEIQKILHQYQKLKIQFTYIKINKILENPLISPKQSIKAQKQRENLNHESSVAYLLQNQNEKMTETATIITEDENELLAKKAEVEKQLGTLLQKKLVKELDYDLKLALVCIYAEIQELEKEEYEKKEKEKLFLELEKEEKIAQKEVEFKEEKLKQLNLEIKKRKKQRLDKIKNESQYRAEEAFAKHNQQLARKLKQKTQNLQTYSHSLTSSYKKALRSFKRTPQQLQSQQFLKQVPEDILNLYRSAREMGVFTDKQFPADNISIGDASKSKYNLFTQNTIWLRPRQIFKENFKLFDGIDPHDIKQGSLGVCYMLATVSALATNHSNIQKIFVFHDIDIGFYVLRLYVNGIPKFFVVDDLIPCCKTTKSPLFTQPIGKQIWVLLLQKAWAKLIGSYLSAESMTPDHMMEDLSGAPAYGWWLTKQNAKTPTQKIKQIVKHSEMGHIVVVTSVSSDKKIQGIVNNHAYSLLGTVQYNNRYVFKIRNPWGRFEWNGEFGEKSSLCTDDFKKKVAYQEKDDGIFFISENQFLKAFCFYSISHVKPDYCYSYINFESKKGENLYFKFKLNKSGDINVRITQPFDRMLNDKNYKYSPMIFELGKILTNQNKRQQVQFISEGHQRTYFGAKSVHAFQDIFQFLEEGSYFLRVRMLWEDDKKYNTAVLGCYASHQIKIERIEQNQGLKLLKSLFLSFSRNSNKHRVTNGYYTISTMKGQFLFIAQTEQQGQFKANFKFTKQKMVRTETQISRLTQIELQTKISKSEYGVCTAMRVEPAQGGTTGPVSITITKI